MTLARVLAAAAFAAPALAAPRAVIFGVSGNIPGTPLEEMTDAWRAAAAKVKGFDWIALSKSLADLRAEPGCATLGPACRARIAKELGADVLFFAKHAPWGGAFEQINIATGTTARKARIAFEAEGEELTAKFRDAGVTFVTGGAPETPAVVAAPIATPGAKGPATPPAPAAAPAPASPPKTAAAPAPAAPTAPPATAPSKTATPAPIAPAAPAPSKPAPSAARKAVVLGMVTGEPGAPLQEITDAWREAAAGIAGYQWLSFSKTLAEMRAMPDCAKFSPACRGRIAKEIGAEVLFFAKQMPWGGAFEQVDVSTGTTTRKGRYPIEGRRDDWIKGGRDAGVKFVTDGAPAQPAGAVAVVLPAAAPNPPTPAPPSPAAAPAPAAPPSPPPAPAASGSPVAKTEPPPALAVPVTQVVDPEISRKPATDVQAKADLAPGPPSMWSRVRVRTWIAAGGTAGLLGAGVVFGLRSRDAENDLNTPERGCETTEQLPVCRDLHDKARTRALIANVLFAAGGAAAIGTGWLFYLDLRSDHAGAQVAVRF